MIENITETQLSKIVTDQSGDVTLVRKNRAEKVAESFTPPPKEYWMKLSDQARLFNRDNSGLRPELLTPPTTAEEWFPWIGSLIRETWTYYDGQEAKRVLVEVNLLGKIAEAFQEWYEIIHQIPELRNVKTSLDLSNIKDGSTLQMSKASNIKIQDRIEIAKAHKLSKDIQFVVASFFYGNSEFHQYLGYYKLLNPVKK